jgi:predicted O-methyltransferase YrrM
MKLIKDLIRRLTNHDKRHYRRISNAGATSPNPWIRKASSIGGWLFEGEPELLYELSKTAEDGNFIEIGCWMGKSTCILAGGMTDSGKTGKIICVDPFTLAGTPEQVAYHRRLLGGAAGTFYEFLGNARTHGFYDRVIPVATFSGTALPSLNVSATLAFIDGAHDYENAKRDLELVYPSLQPGSRIAFHDVGNPDFPGLITLMDELKRRSDVERTDHVGSITVFKKL